MNARQIQLRQHTDGRVAISLVPDRWKCFDDSSTSIPWSAKNEQVSGPGWSELLVTELPGPDGYGDVVGDDGENAQAPWWHTKHGTYAAWREGVEDDWGLQENETLDDVRSDALKMLAAVAACERYRTQEETKT